MTPAVAASYVTCNLTSLKQRPGAEETFDRVEAPRLLLLGERLHARRVEAERHGENRQRVHEVQHDPLCPRNSSFGHDDPAKPEQKADYERGSARRQLERRRERARQNHRGRAGRAGRQRGFRVEEVVHGRSPYSSRDDSTLLERNCYLFNCGHLGTTAGKPLARTRTTEPQLPADRARSVRRPRTPDTASTFLAPCRCDPSEPSPACT